MNIFDLAGYMPNLFEFEPLARFGSIGEVISKVPDNDWNDALFHKEPETPKPLVE